MSSIEKADLDNLKNFFSNRNKEIKNDQDDLMLIIGEHLEKIEQSKLIEEEKLNYKNQLTNLGSFLIKYNKNYSIRESGRKSPDFILTKKKTLINLDLVEVQTNLELKQNEEYIEVLLEELEKEILSENNNIKGVFNLNLKNDAFKSTNRSDVKTMIINEITLKGFENSYIKSIVKTEADNFHLFNSTLGQNKDLNRKEIQSYISTKEKHLVSHKSSENWLLLYFDGGQSSYDYKGIEPSVLTSKFESKFNSILLFDQNKSKVYSLK